MTTEAAGAVALAGVALTTSSLVYVHLRPTGLSPIRNAVSQYGISAFRGGYRAATIAAAVAGAALAVGIGTAVHGAGVSLVVGLLIAFALARAAISWVPMDRPGAERTETGRRHGLLAFVAFASAATAALRLGGILERGTRWHDLATVSSDLGIAMVATFVAMFITRLETDRGRFFGASNESSISRCLSGSPSSPQPARSDRDRARHGCGDSGGARLIALRRRRPRPGVSALAGVWPVCGPSPRPRLVGQAPLARRRL